MADTLLYEIPRQARDNLGDIAKRMEAPANKIRPLVGAAASVRRFVGHPERLSLRSVIEAHDTLLVNPRIELIGEDQASILTNLIVHMLDLQLKRQGASPAARRPRVSLIIDEAHRLITETLITMIATHREAGLNVACAVQYVSQLGADEPSAARREKIIKGVGNLLQTKLLFRMSDSEDADRHSQIFRSVYETMVRADPTSRARMPFDPARMQTLRDHHALVSLVSSPLPDAGTAGLIDPGHGATRLPAFVTQTYPMPDVDEIPDGWRSEHLARQADVFRNYPEDMSALAVRDVPEGLGGSAPTPAAEHEPDEAARVAEQTVGRKPDAAPQEGPHPQTEAASSQSARPDETASYDRRLFERGEQPPQPKPGTPEPDAGPFEGSAGRGPGAGRVGGVRIERRAQAERADQRADSPSPVLRVACRPTDRPLPGSDSRPATPAGEQALRAAATLESITRLGPWRLAGTEAVEQAKRAATSAREQALAESTGPEQAPRRARRAAQQALAPHADAAWRTAVSELSLSDSEAHALEVIARLRLAAHRLLSHLLDEPASERALRERLGHLHEAGLLARSDVGIVGRRGRPPHLYAIAPRGLEYLRLRRAELAPDQDSPRYLDSARKLPAPGKGSEVPHELAVQLCLVALRQYGATATRLHWNTTRMPGGRWDLGMIHQDPRDRTLRLADLVPGPGVSVHGERLDAPATLEPDLSVQLQGPVAGERAVIDLLIEVDRTGRPAYNQPKYAAYDQFLGGWCLRTRRFGRERATRPIVLFVAHTPQTMLALLHGADATMTLGFGGPGRYDPASFDYPGRTHTAFSCLDWLLAGQALSLRLPALPPAVRGSDGELRPERVALLPEEWWPRRRYNDLHGQTERRGGGP